MGKNKLIYICIQCSIRESKSSWFLKEHIHLHSIILSTLAESLLVNDPLGHAFKKTIPNCFCALFSKASANNSISIRSLSTNEPPIKTVRATHDIIFAN